LDSFSHPLPRQEEKDTQLEIEGKRASFAEASASSATAQLNIANQRIEELKIEVKTLNHGIISSKTAVERTVASDKEGLRSQIAILKKEIHQLESLNTDIASRPGRLFELYKQGKLVGLLQ
jgi:50S ribosomal subunit-associated GTPase HflX